MAAVSESATAVPSEPSETTPINEMPAAVPGDAVDGQVASSPYRRTTYKLGDLNIPRPKKKVFSTFLGTARTPSTITWLEWVYMALSLVSIIASVVVTVDRIIDLKREHDSHSETEVHLHSLDDTRADFTFGILLLWTALFSTYHVIVAIVSERPYDLVTYIVSTLIVSLYVVVNYLKTPDPPESKVIRLIITSIFVPLIVGIGVVLCRRYLVSRTLIFNTVGANVDMQKMFMTLLIHDSLLKFDVQMGGSVLILWVQKSFIEDKVDRTELVVIIVGIVITISWVLFAYLAIRLENKHLVYVFYASSWLEPCVVIVNLVRTVQLDHSVTSLIYSAYTCGIIALISRFLSVYTMFLVTKNFGKGLKTKIFKATSPEADG